MAPGAILRSLLGNEARWRRDRDSGGRALDCGKCSRCRPFDATGRAPRELRRRLSVVDPARGTKSSAKRAGLPWSVTIGMNRFPPTYPKPCPRITLGGLRSRVTRWLARPSHPRGRMPVDRRCGVARLVAARWPYWRRARCFHQGQRDTPGHRPESKRRPHRWYTHQA